MRTLITMGILTATLSMPFVVRATDEAFGIAGNEQLLWVAAAVTEGEDQPATVRFRCMKNLTAGFRPPSGIGPVTGRVAKLAALGNALHVVYQDGAQWSYTYRDGAETREATGRQQVSTRLPAPTKPWVWSPSAKQDTLYAIVSGRVAAKLPAAHRPPPATPEIKDAGLAASQPTTDNTTTGLNQALRTRPLAGAVVSYAGGRWRPLENQLIPDWFDEHQQEQVWLAAGDETLHLLYRPAKADAEILHTSRPIHPGSSWSRPEPIGVRGEVAPASAVMIDSKLYFVYAEPSPKNGGPIILRIARRTPQTWETGPYLNDNDQPHPFDNSAGPVVVGAFGEDVATAQRSDSHEIRVMFWSPRTGAHRTDHDRTARLESTPTPIIGPETAQWLLLITITVLFMAAFRRRQLAKPRKDTKDTIDTDE